VRRKRKARRGKKRDIPISRKPREILETVLEGRLDKGEELCSTTRGGKIARRTFYRENPGGRRGYIKKLLWSLPTVFLGGNPSHGRRKGLKETEAFSTGQNRIRDPRKSFLAC